MPLPFARPRLTQSLARRFRLRGFSRSALDETTFPVVIVDDLSVRADFNTGPIEALGWAQVTLVGGQRSVFQLFNDGGVDQLLRVRQFDITSDSNTNLEMLEGTTVLGAVTNTVWQDRRFAARSTIGGVRGLSLAGGLGGTKIGDFRLTGSRTFTWQPTNLLIERGNGIHLEMTSAVTGRCTFQWDEIPSEVN